MIKEIRNSAANNFGQLLNYLGFRYTTGLTRVANRVPQVGDQQEINVTPDNMTLGETPIFLDENVDYRPLLIELNRAEVKKIQIDPEMPSAVIKDALRETLRNTSLVEEKGIFLSTKKASSSGYFCRISKKDRILSIIKFLVDDYFLIVGKYPHETERIKKIIGDIEELIKEVNQFRQNNFEQEKLITSLGENLEKANQLLKEKTELISTLKENLERTKPLQEEINNLRSMLKDLLSKANEILALSKKNLKHWFDGDIADLKKNAQEMKRIIEGIK